MIIALAGAAPWAPPQVRINNTMVKAFARAFRWRRLLEEAQHYGMLVELASAEKINKSYDSWVLRLSLLAPAIIEAILDGRRPAAGGANAAGAAASKMGGPTSARDLCVDKLNLK
jgi:hypothetical protein